DARRFGEANLAEFLGKRVFEQSKKLLAGLGSRFELDAGVDVLGVFAEDDHFDFFGMLHRRRHTLEPSYWPQADIEVEQLPQRDIERAHPAADRRGQRALDADQKFAKRLDRLIR